MSETIRIIGVATTVENGVTYYRAAIDKGGILVSGYRTLHRKFRTRITAEYYARRILKAWYRLHSENPPLAKKGRRFS